MGTETLRKCCTPNAIHVAKRSQADWKGLRRQSRHGHQEGRSEVVDNCNVVNGAGFVLIMSVLNFRPHADGLRWTSISNSVDHYMRAVGILGTETRQAAPVSSGSAAGLGINF